MQRENTSSVSTWYERHKTIIRVHGDIDNASIFALCDEINLAVDYYHYQQIEIQIDSYGGSVSSLEYYLGRLNYWREKKRVRISTLAMTKAASAAAIILSMGDIGYRRAYESTSILYHDTRIVSGEGEVWTKDKLDILHRQLLKTDQHLIEHLARHVYNQKVQSERTPEGAYQWKKMLAVRSDFRELIRVSDPREMLVELDCGEADHLSLEQIQSAYMTLNALDVFIPADIAQKMLLIDEIVADFSNQPEANNA
jgi:ATP-dependent protease ClpP protease subunit